MCPALLPEKPQFIAMRKVTRKTSSGDGLSADQCIPVYAALKAVTIDAVWQYGLDDMLGSLASGCKI